MLKLVRKKFTLNYNGEILAEEVLSVEDDPEVVQAHIRELAAAILADFGDDMRDFIRQGKEV